MPKDFSSQSYTPGGSGQTKSCPPNKVDSSGKAKEKDDLVGLNNKFVQIIDKVKRLEEDKTRLEKKLEILKEQEDYKGKVDELVKKEQNELEQKVENLLRDQEKLKDEQLNNQEELEDTKKRYEDELIRKTDLENQFVIIKKDAEDGHLKAVDLALELEDLIGKLNFLRAGYDEEIRELESQVQNETVVLQEPCKRSLDLGEFIQTVKNQYANMAARTREEAEQWHQRKMNAMVLTAGQREQEVRDVRREISDLVRLIQRTNGDLDALKRKEESLKKEIDDVRQENDENLSRTREDIVQLEEALRRAKQELAGQIREHQELLNLKLALDIEIATYHKLLEGEEKRMNYLMLNSDI